MLVAQHLSFQREAQTLFHNIDIMLQKGEMLQISGPNGSGKTTLLRMLAGFIPPATGCIQRQGKIAWMGHQPGFTPWLTVKENMQLHLQLQKLSAEIGDHLWQQFGLGLYQQRFPAELSAGQRQRLAWLQLWLSQATLWLLDEPFTALDQQAIALGQQCILQHLAAGGLVVLTTHQKVSWAMPIQRLELKEAVCTI